MLEKPWQFTLVFWKGKCFK